MFLDLKTYECVVCRYSTEMKHHMVKHFNHCNAPVKTYQYLKTKNGYECKMCDDRFEIISALKFHFFHKHNDIEALAFYNQKI